MPNHCLAWKTAVPTAKEQAPVTRENIANLHYPAELPIVAHREEIVEAIRTSQVVIVAGDTGSGKTTQLPKMCLEAGRGVRKRIGCTQPRRIAAIAVAERVAEELGDQAGLVGYKIRFKDQTSRNTRLKFMTDGILLAEAHHDGNLSAYDTIIIDEAHERSLNIDFLIGLLKQLLGRRPDLTLLITSATIDTSRFAKHFGNAPVVEVSGRTYPVEVRYQPLDPEKEEEGEQSYVDQAVQAVCELRQNEGPGDILVFMPSERDILETVESLQARLDNAPGQAAPVVLPLFGRLSPGDQKKIFQPVKGQKIVVATNVAETSITVPGVRYVVDTGLARLASYNVRARTSKLPIVAISRASCDQRKGRCGRVGPGVCVRLYAEEDYANRPEYTPPEILRTNLAEVILRMTSLKLGDPAKFPFLDPPSGRAIQDGYALLSELGALDRQRHLTAHGRLMARLPLDPRISRMIIEARDHNALREVTVIAAGLSIQDPRVRPVDKEAAADAAHARFAKTPSDFLFFLALWDAYHATFDKLQSLSRMRKFCASHYLSFLRMREWRDIHEQISQVLGEEEGFAMNIQPAPPEAIHRAILSGNLRNIAVKKEKNLYQTGGGREVMIFPGSTQYGKTGDWLMAAEMVETSRLYARTVAEIKPEWIEPLAGELCRSSYSEAHWEKGRGQVVAFAKISLFGLVIVPSRKVNYGLIKPEEARQIFIQSALIEGELKGEYPFLAANTALVAQLQDMEDRLRLRSIMVDDQALFDFYEERLAPEVRDQRSLNQWLRDPEARARLLMTADDVRQQLPEAAALEQFPLTLAAGECELPLSYRFAPGEEDDGVTARIPPGLAPHLGQELFEWLVPGMLTEKVVFLLKGLPKALRRQLVPIPQTAAEIIRDLPFGRGSLYRTLEQVIVDSFKLRIVGRDWPLTDLPSHLRFRFCLLDGQGEVVLVTRDFSELKGRSIGRAEVFSHTQMAELQACWEQKNITAAQFGQTPAALPVPGTNGAVQGYVYPGLYLDEQQGVGQRLFMEEKEARQSTRQTLLRLYCNEFATQVKSLRKDLAILRSHWALYEGLATHEQINEDLWHFVFFNVFDISNGLSPSAEQFAAKVEAVRGQGLSLLCREIFEEVVRVLQERRATLDAIAKFSALPGKPSGAGPQAERFAEYHRQVSRIVPADFLQWVARPRLPAMCRYLKALRIRAERAQVSPGKDALKAQQVAIHEKRYAQAVSGESPTLVLREHLREYWEMIEEFKVSLFAQELGTAYPVSEKRLEKKWREVEPHQC
ncbi:MAG: ATP-dependent RNA helicase HrpA [Deltaproteobacteria bacterium]|nr:ATP-dependent RNA helicase HrpA [Deltaproteobacteria bacterium]